MIVNEDITRMLFTAKEALGEMETRLLDKRLAEAYNWSRELRAYVGVLSTYIEDAARKKSRR